MSSSRFEYFTDQARQTLLFAQEEASALDHDRIGTEHILLGLLRSENEDSGAVKILQAWPDASLAKIRDATLFIIGRGGRPTPGEIGLTRRSKRVIEFAVDEARRQQRGQTVCTEHLLVGFMREGEGVAAGILGSLGISLRKLRVEMEKLPGPEGQVPTRLTASEGQTLISFTMDISREELDTLIAGMEVLQRFYVRLKDSLPKQDV